MTEQKKLIIFLSQFDLSVSKMSRILEFLGDNASIKSFKKAKFPNDILTAEQFLKMVNSAEEKLINTYVINLANRGIKIITKFEQGFPKKLFDLPECPYILYYMGDLSLADKPSLSIVGSRKPSSYGRMVTEKLARELALAGVVIVSGLAYGVDSIAHRQCLEVGGKTIAILGGGFDHIYPAEHIDLAREIAEKGLLLSEFRPKKVSTKYAFPLRNRIIAGLSEGTLITEATIKSGTIHTKDFALEYGKAVYAVPGNIDNPLSGLTNDALKSGQAKLVTESDDIFKDYEGKIRTVEVTKSKDIEKTTSNNDEKIILDILKNGMTTLEELTKFAGLNAQKVNSCLTTLEISGLISRLPSGVISLN